MSDPARVIDLSVEALRAIVREEIGRAAPPPAEEREILTSKQAAAIVQVHPDVLLRYIKSRGLPAIRLGAEWRFKRSEILAWLEAQGPAVTKPRRALRTVKGVR